MSRIKTKALLATVAILIALSFVAGMVLQNGHEPKVIGNLSPKDVSEISKVTLMMERDALKEEIHILFKQREIKEVMKTYYRYFFVRVLTIQQKDGGTVLVTIGTETNQGQQNIYITQTGGHWR